MPQVLRDLAKLPADAPEYTVAHDVVVDLQHALAGKTSQTPEEQELSAKMRTVFDDARDEGRNEGRLDGIKSSLRRVLAARKLAATPADEAKIDTCTDATTLERWLDQALTADTAAAALRGKGVRTQGHAKPRRRSGASA